ncbi:hypothetical protein WCU73_00160 [Pectobacterium brasiliense]|uniref:hypothetical protein n=1 Tax=Pectobacterium brasiliense TaxID=180957 RepID=UPI0030178D90
MAAASKQKASACNCYPDRGIPAERLQKFIKEVADDIRAGNTLVDTASMTETDAVFALDVILQYMKTRTVSSMTKEKRQQQRRLYSKALFLETLEKDGGVYNSAEAAEILGRTKTTVKNWKDSHQLLALEIDGEFYYPVFQFTDDERISEKGVLRGVSEILPLLKNFSDRMQYSFFMEERNNVLNGISPPGRTFTVAEILRHNPGKELWAEIHRLARIYGTQDAA